MSSGMNVEQAKELASKRNYKWAVGNLKYAFKGVAYKKATTILLHELAEIADRLVLCKDCKYWLSEDDGTIHVCEITEAVTNADDFCSYGERRSVDDLIEQIDNLIAFEKELIGDCNICRFVGCSECDDCINGSQWVRMTREDEK